MAEIVQSLFGVSPEMYQQRQEDQASARAMQFARLTPIQQANYAIGRGAYGLAGAVGGALGGQDPELQRITMRQQIASQLNPNDPASIEQAISALMQAGDTQGGMMLQGEYRKLKESGALVAQRMGAASASEAAARRERAPATTPDIINARALALLNRTSEELKALPPSPDRDAALRDVENELSNLTTLTAKTPKSGPSVGVDAERFSLALYDKNFADLTPTERAVVNSRVDQKKSIGQEIGEGLGLLGKALAPALKKEGEETGKFSAKNYDELGGAVAAGISSKRNLDTLNSALKNAFTGTLSDTKTSIVKALDGIGLPVGDDLKKAASSTELLNAMSTRYVFPLVKNFPGSLAAKELDRLEKTAPTALQQPETITRLVNLLRTDISENEYTYNKAKEYRSQNKSLIGFNQADQKIDFQNKFNRMQTLYDKFTKQSGGSVAEKAEFDSLKRELGVK